MQMSFFLATQSDVLIEGRRARVDAAILICEGLEVQSASAYECLMRLQQLEAMPSEQRHTCSMSCSAGAGNPN